MKKNRENRRNNKTIRFTEKELDEINSAMKSYGYLSFSKYVRETIMQRSRYKNRKENEENGWL